MHCGFPGVDVNSFPGTTTAVIDKKKTHHRHRDSMAFSHGLLWLSFIHQYDELPAVVSLR